MLGRRCRGRCAAGLAGGALFAPAAAAALAALRAHPARAAAGRPWAGRAAHGAGAACVHPGGPGVLQRPQRADAARKHCRPARRAHFRPARAPGGHRAGGRRRQPDAACGAGAGHPAARSGLALRRLPGDHRPRGHPARRRQFLLPRIPRPPGRAQPVGRAAGHPHRPQLRLAAAFGPVLAQAALGCRAGADLPAT